MLHTLAVRVSRRKAALVEMIVDLINAPAAGFADFAFVRGE